MIDVNPFEIRFDGIRCHIAIRKVLTSVVVLKISGTDVGEFGAAPMLELDRILALSQPTQLFIDAREVRGASIDVSSDWAKWLAAQKGHLQTIHILTGSRFIQITADFVRRFADLQGIMNVHTEPAVFDAELAQVLKNSETANS
jgi:hypothetical protein